MNEFKDNDSSRKESLKNIIMELHEGATVDEVKEKFQDLIKDVTHQEVADMEQALLEDGVPVEEVKKLCDSHAAVFKEALESKQRKATLPGHPLHTLKIENAEIIKAVKEMKNSLSLLKADETDTFEKAKKDLELLKEVSKHYLRKENVLFPYLEKYGFYGPSKVMWAIHDDIRAGLKGIDSMLSSGDASGFDYGPTLASIVSMEEKEENILIPTLLEKLNEKDWQDIIAQSDEIGYTLIEPVKFQTDNIKMIDKEKIGTTPIESGKITLQTGLMTQEQIALMLKHLPFDITFVDENDQVAFYSEGDRIFPRSPAIIGRDVQNCHPPASVDIVNKIVAAFKAGEKDVAEFWIPMGELLVHIRYFAVRDDAGVYKGVIEVSQNIAPLKKIEGMRRLLDWD